MDHARVAIVRATIGPVKTALAKIVRATTARTAIVRARIAPLVIVRERRPLAMIVHHPIVHHPIARMVIGPAPIVPARTGRMAIAPKVVVPQVARLVLIVRLVPKVVPSAVTAHAPIGLVLIAQPVKVVAATTSRGLPMPKPTAAAVSSSSRQNADQLLRSSDGTRLAPSR